MDARRLDVFHHAADEDIVLVGHGVDIQFDGVGEELVDQNRLVRRTRTASSMYVSSSSSE